MTRRFLAVNPQSPENTRKPRRWSPLDALTQIRDADLPVAHKAILWTLAGYADAEGESWPAVATVARGAGVSVSTARRALRDLVAAEWVEVVERVVEGAQTSNLYRLRPTSPAAARPGNVIDLRPDPDLATRHRVAEVVEGLDSRPPFEPPAPSSPTSSPEPHFKPDEDLEAPAPKDDDTLTGARADWRGELARTWSTSPDAPVNPRAALARAADEPAARVALLVTLRSSTPASRAVGYFLGVYRNTVAEGGAYPVTDEDLARAARGLAVVATPPRSTSRHPARKYGPTEAQIAGDDLSHYLEPQWPGRG